jgi:hypothetical protein
MAVERAAAKRVKEVKSDSKGGGGDGGGGHGSDGGDRHDAVRAAICQCRERAATMPHILESAHSSRTWRCGMVGEERSGVLVASCARLADERVQRA